MLRRAKEFVTCCTKALFFVGLILASPIIVPAFAAGWLGDRIRDRWPGSPRAQAIGYWLPKAFPLVGIVVLAVLLIILITRVPAEKW